MTMRGRRPAESYGDHVDFRKGTFHGSVTGKVEHHHHYGPAPTATASLPAAPVVFTGRGRQAAQLMDVLKPDVDGTADPVLISALSGLGGIGKTALALHVAHAVRTRFTGGTLFVNMRGYEDIPVAPEQAVLSLLRALGIRDEDLPQSPEEQYALYRSELSGRGPVLLLFDNVSTSAQVTPLLPGTDRHRVLVTSRDSLASLPARLITLDSLSQGEAAVLIRRALHLADPEDSRINEEPDAVQQLVDLCDGLPLALQIAAAQLRRRRHRPVSVLVTELKAAADRVRQLHAPGVDQYGRELALRPLFDVTYARLDSDQARCFRSLAQAPGANFGVPTASALSGLPETKVEAALDDLAAAFLINPRGDRWEMHDLLRAYARTISSGEPGLYAEAAHARKRLLHHFLPRMVSADQHLHGQLLEDAPDLFTSREAALDWLDVERDSLVGAVRWADSAEHSQSAMALGLALDKYLQLRRQFTDAQLVAEVMLTAAKRDAEQTVVMASLTIIGNSRYGLGQFREAAIAHTEALRLAYTVGDRNGQASSWTNLGRCMFALEQFEVAVLMHKRAQGMFAALGDQHREAAAWNNLGLPLHSLHRLDEAVQAHSNAQRMFADVLDRHGEAGAWLSLGTALAESDKYDDAVNAYMNATDIYAEQDDPHGAAWAWEHLGQLLARTGELEMAVKVLQQCEAAYAALGDGRGAASIRSTLAELRSRKAGRIPPLA
ncbi:ATP-binding protein [Streptomyces sp. TLI_55]|uniref:ATP-binding protein n=1 Tax=Streptomyces sp. TLI_55 TaxID=1938861 RepID=UPI0011807A1E|nr:tetratricopeptide repeat protein [Streptomyces sp. TLI_55]